MALLVFTDLDGTLLDHHTYSHAEARPALDALAARGWPLVLCSSKTRAEMIPLHAELGLSHPIISENGGAIFAPADCPVATGNGWQEAGGGWLAMPLGMAYAELRRRFAKFKDDFGARGFGDMSDLEVAELTGLSPEAAARARQREFNEPLLLPDPAAQHQAFVRAAEDAGLQVTRGGRFHHLLGGGSKGRAVKLLSGLYRAADPALVTMALGDAPNDAPMLEQVDRPVLVAGHDGGHAGVNLDGLTRERLPGPAGFNHAVLAEVDRHS